MILIWWHLVTFFWPHPSHSSDMLPYLLQCYFPLATDTHKKKIVFFLQCLPCSSSRCSGIFIQLCFAVIAFILASLRNGWHLIICLVLALIFEKQDVYFLTTLDRIKQTGGFFCVMSKWYIHSCDISPCFWWLKSYFTVNVTFKDNPCVSHVTSRMYPTPGQMTPAPHGSIRNK